MTKRNSPGYLLPEDLQPDENICVCVPVPKDERHILAFLGQILQLGYWYTWERDSEKKARLAAQPWREIYQCVSEEINCIMTTGCGCGGERQPIGQRLTEDGILEVTYDGETWEEQRAGDTRFSNPTLPPIYGADGGEKRCRAANSIVTGIEAEKIETEGRYAGGATAADFVAGLVAFLVGLGVITGGISAVLAVITTAIAALLANITAAQFSGYFTGATWDALLCIVYCNMNDDASFSETQWQTIRQQVIADIGGGAGNWIEKIILGMGTVGLTNMARQELPGTKDCDLCDCPSGTWCYTFDFTAGQQGWAFTESGFGTYTGGVGFTGQPYGTGGGVSRLQRTFDEASVTSIQVVHSAQGYTVGQKTLVLKRGSDPDQNHSLGGALNGESILSQYNQANFTPFDLDRITLFWDGAGSSDMAIESVTLRGIGTNPFGEDNCV